MTAQREQPHTIASTLRSRCRDLRLLATPLALVRTRELSGTLPNRLFDATTIVSINLQEAGKLSGVLPPGLGKLSRLEYFWTRGSKLSGTISADIGKVQALTTLHAQDTGVSGTLPSQMTALKSLLNFAINGISGTLPAQLTRLNKIEAIQFHNGKVSGTLPDDMDKLKSLERLLTYNNRMSGTLPKKMSKLTKLTGWFQLYGNRYSGTLPAELSKLHSKSSDDESFEEAFFLVQQNQLSGTIPAQFGGSTFLERLKLDSNRFSGTLPAQLGQLSNAKILYVSQNPSLSGTLPSQLTKAEKLEQLAFDGTAISGTLPSQLSTLSNLKILQAGWQQGTQLSGTLPTQLGELPEGINIKLRGNALISGFVPTQLAQLNALTCELHDSGVSCNSAVPQCANGCKYAPPFPPSPPPPAPPPPLPPKSCPAFYEGGKSCKNKICIEPADDSSAGAVKLQDAWEKGHASLNEARDRCAELQAQGCSQIMHDSRTDIYVLRRDTDPSDDSTHFKMTNYWSGCEWSPSPPPPAPPLTEMCKIPILSSSLSSKAESEALSCCDDRASADGVLWREFMGRSATAEFCSSEWFANTCTENAEACIDKPSPLHVVAVRRDTQGVGRVVVDGHPSNNADSPCRGFNVEPNAMPSMCMDPAERWAGARCCKVDDSGKRMGASYCGSPERSCTLYTYAEAAAGCASLGVGWQVCTEAEVAAMQPAGSGCSYDDEYVWTDTACTLDTGAGARCVDGFCTSWEGLTSALDMEDTTWILEGLPTSCWTRAEPGRSSDVSASVRSTRDARHVVSLEACQAYCATLKSCRGVEFSRGIECVALGRSYKEMYFPASFGEPTGTAACSESNPGPFEPWPICFWPVAPRLMKALALLAVRASHDNRACPPSDRAGECGGAYDQAGCGSKGCFDIVDSNHHHFVTSDDNDQLTITRMTKSGSIDLVVTCACKEKDTCRTLVGEFDCDEKIFDLNEIKIGFNQRLQQYRVLQPGEEKSFAFPKPSLVKTCRYEVVNSVVADYLEMDGTNSHLCAKDVTLSEHCTDMLGGHGQSWWEAKIRSNVGSSLGPSPAITKVHRDATCGFFTGLVGSGCCKHGAVYTQLPTSIDGCADGGGGDGWTGIKDHNPKQCASHCSGRGHKYFTIAKADGNCKCHDVCNDANHGHKAYELGPGTRTKVGDFYTRQQCQDACQADALCSSFEVHGCTASSANCGGTCYLFKDADADVTAGDCTSCVRIVTGTGSSNDGTLNVYFDQGSGYQEATAGKTWSKGSTVLDECYAGLLGIRVTNPTNNAWTGKVEVATDGSYGALSCVDCTAGSSTAAIVVDGKADSGNQASTRCWNGKTCTLAVPLPHTGATGECYEMAGKEDTSFWMGSVTSVEECARLVSMDSRCDDEWFVHKPVAANAKVGDCRCLTSKDSCSSLSEQEGANVYRATVHTVTTKRLHEGKVCTPSFWLNKYGSADECARLVHDDPRCNSQYFGLARADGNCACVQADSCFTSEHLEDYASDVYESVIMESLDRAWHADLPGRWWWGMGFQEALDTIDSACGCADLLGNYDQSWWEATIADNLEQSKAFSCSGWESDRACPEGSSPMALGVKSSRDACEDACTAEQKAGCCMYRDGQCTLVVDAASVAGDLQQNGVAAICKPQWPLVNLEGLWHDRLPGSWWTGMSAQQALDTLQRKCAPTPPPLAIASCSAAAACDGDKNTGYVRDSMGAATSLTFALSAPSVVRSVEIQAAIEDGYPRDWKLEGSDDGRSWTTLLSAANGAAPIGAALLEATTEHLYLLGGLDPSGTPSGSVHRWAPVDYSVAELDKPVMPKASCEGADQGRNLGSQPSPAQCKVVAAAEPAGTCDLFMFAPGYSSGGWGCRCCYRKTGSRRR